MAAYLTFADLEPLAPGLTQQVADIYIADVEAQASIDAPCIMDPAFPEAMRGAVVSVLRQAVLRWWRTGEGSVTTHQKTAGQFSETSTFDSSRGRSGEGRLYPAEVQRLQRLCADWKATRTGRKAFSIRPKAAR